MEDKILKTGSNELEIVLFEVGEQNFGINVAKVREILKFEGFTAIPHSPKPLLGIFTSRNRVLPLISLRRYMGLSDEEDMSKSKVIVTDYFNLKTAFLVDRVFRLYRIKWEDIVPPSEYDSATSSFIIGTIKLESDLVHLIDFEKIVIEMNPDVVRLGIDEEERKIYEDIKIVVADDSDTTRKLIIDTLTKLGYPNIVSFKNGKEAWDYISGLKKRAEVERVNLQNYISILITDIEMPQMDGYTLTKLIKEDEILKSIPVIIFSSISAPEVHFKKDIVGADVHITKYDIGKLENYIRILLKLKK